MQERTVQAHEFWRATCGLDTYRRGKGHARIDTPWNAFTEDGKLVCTIWRDRIAGVFDPLENRLRRFVRLGGKSRVWKGVAVAHGQDARDNLERAIVAFRHHVTDLWRRTLRRRSQKDAMTWE